jgi:hypothetical protein
MKIFPIFDTTEKMTTVALKYSGNRRGLHNTELKTRYHDTTEKMTTVALKYSGNRRGIVKFSTISVKSWYLVFSSVL